MRTRREIKKSWMKMKMMVKFASHRKSVLNQSDQEFFDEIKHADGEKFDNILRKRDVLHNNSELLEIFTMFWLVLKEDVTDGVLSKEGYVKFNIYAQAALIGDIDKEESLQCAETEYDADIKSFGEMTKTAFFDTLIELIEAWSEIIDHRYVTAVAWALLGSLLDIKAYPPRFRPIKDVKCITEVINNHAALMTNFSHDKKDRQSIRVINEWMNGMDLHAEVQKRVGLRREATMISSHSKDMIEITNRRLTRGSSFLSDGSIGSLDKDSLSQRMKREQSDLDQESLDDGYSESNSSSLFDGDEDEDGGSEGGGLSDDNEVDGDGDGLARGADKYCVAGRNRRGNAMGLSGDNDNEDNNSRYSGSCLSLPSIGKLTREPSFNKSSTIATAGGAFPNCDGSISTSMSLLLNQHQQGWGESSNAKTTSSFMRRRLPKNAEMLYDMNMLRIKLQKDRAKAAFVLDSKHYLVNDACNDMFAKRSLSIDDHPSTASPIYSSSPWHPKRSHKHKAETFDNLQRFIEHQGGNSRPNTSCGAANLKSQQKVVGTMVRGVELHLSTVRASVNRNEFDIEKNISKCSDHFINYKKKPLVDKHAYIRNKVIDVDAFFDRDA